MTRQEAADKLEALYDDYMADMAIGRDLLAIAADLRREEPPTERDACKVKLAAAINAIIAGPHDPYCDLMRAGKCDCWIAETLEKIRKAGEKG